jgi:RNA polymerase sigma-70 factor, ECF subfamily
MSTDPSRIADLMARHQAGDSKAFEELYRMTVEAVERFQSRWSSNAAERDDLVQETFLQVHRARRTYRPGMPVEPWLFAIARHVALVSARTRRRRWSREVGMDELPQRPAEAEASQPDPILGRRLDAALSSLPADQRDLLRLAHFEDLSSPEIAARVGASPGAVKVRLHRIHRRLRGWLGPTGPEPGSGDPKEGS